MSDIFDKILAGNIPCYKIYEDDAVLAFLDISQVTPGHTLVIPKANVATIFDYSDDLAARVLGRLPKIAKAIQASDPAIVGMNIQSNNGEAAGQTVAHSHWHLIPRYRHDDLADRLNPTISHADNYTDAIYNSIAAQITAQL